MLASKRGEPMVTNRWATRWTAAALLGLLLQATVLPAHAEEYAGDDPPGRAARLSVISGNVGLRSAGDSEWSAADANQPLTTGDALDLSADARAEIDFGGAQVRLDGDTQAYLDRLDDNVARVDVRSGTASLDIDDTSAGIAYEVRTPTIAFAPSGDGEFRVDVDHNGVTTLTLMQGEGTVYGNNGAHYDVHGNQSYRFEDSELRNVVGQPRPERDGFDRWVAEREHGYAEGVTRQYVDQGVAGAADLDAYGRWDVEDDYGAVWYPRVVVQDWAPYRYGRWRFVRPWGWTWLDDAPWGYAPFHYGRWAYVRNRWGWVPGPRYVRPVYSPALVGFVGGPSLFISIHSGPPVGWFPLGPRDVYCPPYRHSRNYFTRVNVTNVTVNRTVINNVYEDVHVRGRGNQVNYTYRNNNRATTVASRDDFEHGRRLGNNNRLRVSDDQLARAQLTTDLAPRGGGSNGPGRDNRPGGGNNNRGNDRDDRGGFGNAPRRDSASQDRDDHPGRGNASADRNDRPGNGNGPRDRDDRPASASQGRDDRRANGNASQDRSDRPGNGNAPQDRPGRGDAQAATNGRPRDDDRGNASPGRGGNSGNGSRPAGGNRGNSPSDDPRSSRPMSPTDFQPQPRASTPSPSNGASNGVSRRSSGDTASRGRDRRMWSTSDDNAVRYQAPTSQPTRSYRTDPVPRSSGSPDRGTSPRAVPSQPSSPPPAMNPGGGRNNPSGRGNAGPTRGDDGGRGNGGGRQSQSQGGGNNRNARTQE